MTKRVFSTLLAGLLLFAACGKDDDNNGTSNGNGGGSTGGTTPAVWVDLGLPSGLLWAECNLGATTPEGYGDYYAWGETTTKETYNWSTYIYCNGSDTTMTKYCTKSSYGIDGFTDNKTVLEAMDDATTQVLGNGARIPTREEWDELINNTTSEWTTQNGVAGCKLISTANGRSLFLPAAGLRWDGELRLAGEGGYYWSASLFAGFPDGAWRFSFNVADQRMNGGSRGGGLSVRAVRSAR